MALNRGTCIRLSWVSLVLAIASWFLAAVIPVGLELGAVAAAVIALAGFKKEEKKKQRIAWAGLIIGVIKLIVTAGLFVWVIIAFARNPVAH